MTVEIKSAHRIHSSHNVDHNTVEVALLQSESEFQKGPIPHTVLMSRLTVMLNILKKKTHKWKEQNAAKIQNAMSFGLYVIVMNFLFTPAFVHSSVAHQYLTEEYMFQLNYLIRYTHISPNSQVRESQSAFTLTTHSIYLTHPLTNTVN